MTLTPQQILQCIDNAKFSDAERAIVHFVLFNVDEKTELNVASSNDALESNTQQNQVVLETICNNYVTVITKLFCHPRYSPNEEIISTFLSYKFVIEWLFSASMWKNTDAIIEHLGLAQLDRFGQIKVNTNRKKVTLLLGLVCLSSKFRLPWKLLFKANPAIALSSYIGLVTQSIPALSQESNAGFNYLLESAKDLPMLELPVVKDLGKLNYGFFNCSYATSPDKYAFKKWLTSLIRHNLPQWLDNDVKSYIANIKPLKSKVKLKVAVMLEQYSKNHAMYRSFNTRLCNLAKEFELIAYIDKNEIKSADLTVFSKIVGLENVFDINANAKLVISEKPDIVFYPSIGMKFWGIYLSQIRLASIQIMMGGHPSSSFSPEIDYCLIPGDTFTAEDIQPFFNEKIVMTGEHSRNTQVQTIHSALTKDFITEHSQFLADDEEFRIAINGIMTKVTYSVIDLCKKIQSRTSKKITFVFFSGFTNNQLGYLSTKKQISRMLKKFDLVSFSDYLDYMKTLSKCHLFLPSLPFGSANSNIDAMILNKPKLFIKGCQQLYTRTDHINWHRVGLVEELGNNTIEEIVNSAIILIEDKEQRKKLHQLIAKKCVYKNVYNDDQNNKHSINEHFEITLSDHFHKTV
jgi:hypothetical protein